MKKLALCLGLGLLLCGGAYAQSGAHKVAPGSPEWQKKREIVQKAAREKNQQNAVASGRTTPGPTHSSVGDQAGIAPSVKLTPPAKRAVSTREMDKSPKAALKRTPRKNLTR